MQCKNNLHQIGLAYGIYFEATSQEPPRHGGLAHGSSAYLRVSTATYICPEDTETAPRDRPSQYVFHPIQNTNLFVPLVPGPRPASAGWELRPIMRIHSTRLSPARPRRIPTS